MKEFVYTRLTGPTASFRIPSFIDGIQMGLSTPGYSNILGLLSFAVGREVKPKDTRIGFSYSFKNTGLDLENFHRYERKSDGGYKYNATNIRKREVHYEVSLDLFLDNISLYDALDHPKQQLFFGRSQDLVNVEEVTITQCNSVDNGKLQGTLLPINIQQHLPGDGIFYNLPEYFDYEQGKVRIPRNVRTFISLPQYVQEIEYEELYNDKKTGIDFYLHRWKEK